MRVTLAPRGRILGLLLVASSSLAAPATWARDCSSAGSLVPNCGFDIDTSGWGLIGGGGGWVGADCATAPGCAEIARDPSGLNAWVVSSCFAVEPLTTYEFGLTTRLQSGTVDAFCQIELSPAEDDNCIAHLGSDIVLPVTVTPAWAEQTALVTTESWMHSTTIALYCVSIFSDFVVRLDDAIVVPVDLFNDGFESGDTSSWTSTFP